MSAWTNPGYLAYTYPMTFGTGQFNENDTISYTTYTSTTGPAGSYVWIPTEKEVKKMSYKVYEVVFVKAPTKTEEEQGIGATIVSGRDPILVVATSEQAAVAQAGKQTTDDLSSSLIHALVRQFGLN